MYGCHGYGGKQKWVYEEDTKMLKHGDNCFVHAGGAVAEVAVCDPENLQHQWEWISLS